MLAELVPNLGAEFPVPLDGRQSLLVGYTRTVAAEDKEPDNDQGGYYQTDQDYPWAVTPD